MSGIMHLVPSNYNEFADVRKDPVVDTWLFMSSPVPIISILVCYLLFVLKIGPALMANRKPFNLQALLIGYNFYQVLFSLWLFTMPYRVGVVQLLLQFTCQISNIEQYTFALSTGAWWYFFSKIIELLDTVFFVLRKKQNQVSFLHVYHHTVTAFFSWGYLKFIPGEQGVMIGCLNSFVHVIMYTYYMLAAMGPKYQKYLWWKKYMTWIQLTQFGMMLLYLLILHMKECNVPLALSYFFVTNIVIFMYLFFNFYRKAYKKKAID